MNVKEYEYLLLIEECGNLSRAAKKAGVSQPALSKFLMRLEFQLDCRLFDRNGKNLIPTAAGEIYLGTCRKIVDIQRRTYASIMHFPSQKGASITISVTPHRGIQMFGDVSPSFYKRYPEINLFPSEGYMAENKKAIMNGDSDLALGTFSPGDDIQFDFASSVYDELVLVVPVSHPAASLSDDSGLFFPAIDINRFYDTPFVMWGNKTSNRILIDRFFERNLFKPTVIYEGNDMQVINELLKTGIGAGFLPKKVCGAKQNRVYFSFWPPLHSYVGVFSKKGRPLSEAERFFIYLILKKSSSENAARPIDIYFNEFSQKIIKEFERTWQR